MGLNSIFSFFFLRSSSEYKRPRTIALRASRGAQNQRAQPALQGRRSSWEGQRQTQQKMPFRKCHLGGKERTLASICPQYRRYLLRTQGYKPRSNSNKEHWSFSCPPHSSHTGPASPAWCWKAVTGAEPWQTLFALTRQRRRVPARQHSQTCFLGRKTSPALVSCLQSVTSPHWWRPLSSPLRQQKHARSSAFQLPLQPPHGPGWELARTAAELEETRGSDRNTPQNPPETGTNPARLKVTTGHWGLAQGRAAVVDHTSATAEKI